VATCKTCGSSLHSELSRTFGQCGACRDAADSIEAQRVAAEREKGEPPGASRLNTRPAAKSLESTFGRPVASRARGDLHRGT
jgi:hypothetical protein